MTEDDLQAIEARAEEANRARWSDEPIDERVLLTDVPALVAEVRRLRCIVDSVAQKFIGTEHEVIARERAEALPQAVESLRAHRDQLARWCGIK